MGNSEPKRITGFPGLLVSIGLFCFTLAGCGFLMAKQESRDFYASTVLVGRVSADSAGDKPVVVAAYEKRGERLVIAHSTFLHVPGSYELIVPKGVYRLFAFSDTDGNLTYDEGEPAGEFPEAITASGTGVIAEINFLLTNSHAVPPGLPVGTSFPVKGTRPPHSTQIGALADLDDPVFSRAFGEHGYWAPMSFFKEAGGNIYFLEPYDPKKTPILFVHGAAGSPQNWRAFFDSLDRKRYQAWFFHYPSGASVDSMAHLLYWKLYNLQMTYRFERLYLTAHSMGGLVARAFLLHHGREFPSVKLFVSIATPWGGEPLSELGVAHSPVVIPSWKDMQPQGRFMKALFSRKLPPGIDQYLFFGYKGSPTLFRPNNDGTITLASQLRTPAQDEARMIYGFDEDHTSILVSPQVLAQYKAILDSVEPAGSIARPLGGNVRIHFSYDDPGTGSRPLPVLVLKPLEAGRSIVTLPLMAEHAGREIGPLPFGEYDASLLSDAYGTEPRMVRVAIGDARTPVLDFHLIPQGTLSGFIGADVSPEESSAGSYRPPNPTAKISSITLTGAGERRRLVPRRLEDGDAAGNYLAGQDEAIGPFFSFRNLPEGNYQLKIEAVGYLPYTARYTVVPGRSEPLRPIELSPLR